MHNRLHPLGTIYNSAQPLNVERAAHSACPSRSHLAP